MFATEQLIRMALAEDLGSGDITTVATVPTGIRGEARLVAREAGVLAGLDVFCRVYRTLDAAVQIEPRAVDGARMKAGDTVAVLRGLVVSLLTGERTALNFIQHLSGIATLTRRFVDLVAGSGALIVDTRKTTPGWRSLEKYAVRVGGGKNHRMGLFDGVLIKDNHLQAAGSLPAAIRQARELAPHTLRIEVEVETLDQLREACQAGAEIVLLDNMEVETMRRAVAWRGENFPAVLLEASGGINLDTVAMVAQTGVDFISVGALTHSARAIDLALDLDVVT
jgi:nicotinate-nucleotide pyrophosphorylase (carboxylating)